MKTKSFKILDQYFLRFYRSIMSKNGKRRKHTIVDKNDILECQSLIWKVIRDKYLDNEGGVYINNIGYLWPDAHLPSMASINGLPSKS